MHGIASGGQVACVPIKCLFPSPILISGVRNYLKEALVNIIAVHAEVSYH